MIWLDLLIHNFFWLVFPQVAKEEEAERLEAVKSEKEEDLSVCQDPVIAQQAKLLFQKIDKEIAARPTAPPTTSLVRTPSDSRWSRASFGEAPKDIEVVHGSEPGYKEQVEVETAALSERYRVSFTSIYHELYCIRNISSLKTALTAHDWPWCFPQNLL